VGTRDLVRSARDVGRVVVTVTRLVVAIREDGQMALGVRRHELRLCARIVKGLFAGVKLEVNAVLDRSTNALSASMALTATVVSWNIVNVVVSSRARHALTLRVALVFELVLVFLIAAVAFGVVRLGLARTATVLALLDGATLGVDVM
jgi:hypothetical protein